MKRCSYCAEEIQDQAVKCRYCGEWLKDKEDSSQDEPISIPIFSKESEAAKNTNVPNSQDVQPSLSTGKGGEWQLLKYSLLTTASVIFIDMLFGIYTSALSKSGLDTRFLRIMLFSIYISLGVFAAGYFYKLVKFMQAVLLSFVNLFILRGVLFMLAASSSLNVSTSNTDMTSAIGTIMLNTFLESIFVYIPLIACVYLLKGTESKLDFGESLNIKRNIKDLVSKKKYDEGTCSKCGQVTIIAKERGMPFSGKSQRYFCEHCKSFIDGNPVKSALQGIAESVFGFFVFLGFIAIHIGNKEPSTDNASTLSG